VGEDNPSGSSGTLGRINSKVKDLKGVMADNIGIVLRRGEKVDLLVQKSEVLDINAGAFRLHVECRKCAEVIIFHRRNATALHRAMYWKNMKTYITFGGIVRAPRASASHLNLYVSMYRVVAWFTYFYRPSVEVLVCLTAPNKAWRFGH